MQRRRAILAICAVLMAAAGAAAGLLWSPQPEYDLEALRKARLMEDIMFGRAAIGGPFLIDRRCRSRPVRIAVISKGEDAGLNMKSVMRSLGTLLHLFPAPGPGPARSRAD